MAVHNRPSPLADSAAGPGVITQPGSRCRSRCGAITPNRRPAARGRRADRRLPRRVLVLETHRPSFTITGSARLGFALDRDLFAVGAGHRPARTFTRDPLREGCQAPLERLLRLARPSRSAYDLPPGGRRCLSGVNAEISQPFLRLGEEPRPDGWLLLLLIFRRVRCRAAGGSAGVLRSTSVRPPSASHTAGPESPTGRHVRRSQVAWRGHSLLIEETFRYKESRLDRKSCRTWELNDYRKVHIFGKFFDDSSLAMSC